MTDKRFTEIISIQKVIDNKTGKEYDCLIDDNLLKLLNELHEENQRLKELVYSFRDIDDLNNWRQDYENQMSRENKSSEV